MKKTMRRKPTGVALVTAIFLLVVLSGLGVAMVSLSTSQQAGAVQDEQGARAHEAARAGIEWALFTVTQGGTTPRSAALTCPTTFAMPASTTLSSFTVTISCTGGAVDYGGATADHFRITATACNGPRNSACPNAARGPDYVQRVINAQL